MKRSNILGVAAMTVWMLCGGAAMAEESIKYLTGGIGLAEREALAAAEKEYSLKIEMATTGGFYVANAHVIIWNKAGDMVLEATSDGPLMLADLPAGSYSVDVIYQDKEQKKPVTIDGKSMKKLMFVWTTEEK